jgi:hypothetical protein
MSKKDDRIDELEAQVERLENALFDGLDALFQGLGLKMVMLDRGERDAAILYDADEDAQVL